ncbi:MAG: putative Cyclic nucleotide-binding protein [Actinomycetia bacterium]|jgi:SulP family sulfate permease|nr:putative Cyclic nucleotide-binding protein [Actinomycetes bacterium]
MGVAEETVPGQRAVSLGTVVAGIVIGGIEVVFAVSFAALVFAGYLEFYFLDDGVGLYLGAAALTLAFMAWRAGRRGVVGGLQGTGATMIAVVSASAVVHGAGSPKDIFLTALAAIVVVMVLCGIVFLWLGSRRRGDLIRFVPYPVVGGLLAGTGWLLFKGGIHVASGVSPLFTPLGDLVEASALQRWLPALAFGVILLVAVRVIKRPLVMPAVIVIGLGGFVVGMVVTGSSIEEVRGGGWLLGSFDSAILWKTWTLSALGGADWLAVLESWAGILVAVFVATIAILFNISGTELILDRDLDTNQELRDAGMLHVVSGALGGIPGSHALSFTALATGMRVDAQAAGLIAALVPLAAVLFGAPVVGLIPRMIVGGVLIFLGLALIVEWIRDKRRSLPPLEYAVVVLILAGVIAWGFLVGVVIGLVLAVVLFAVSYGRIELVREVAFGETYRSNVDRPATERAELRTLSDRVQILRVSGFVFFGSANRLLERIRRRTESMPPRFLVIDLRRVTGVDSSAVVSFRKMLRLAEVAGSEIVFTSASDPVRAQLVRGGVDETEGSVSFEPDLDRGLQRCEDALLSAPGLADAQADHPAGRRLDGLPAGLGAQLERVSVPEGTVLLHQDDPPGDVYVLDSGRLGVETTTPEGTRIRLRTLRPGVVVGEIALYTGVERTADVVAEVPSVVLRIGRESIERLEAEEPELAAALHRWLATTLAERLTDTMRTFDVLLD